MKKSLMIGAFAVLLCLPGAVMADHIHGHHNYEATWPVPIPGRQHFNGGVAFVTAIGPLGSYEVTDAVFDIVYVSDGKTPAKDILIEASIATESGYLTTHVSGADLGFGSGPGTFEGSFSTHDLDGVVLPGFLGPNSLVDLTLGAVNGGIEGEGYFDHSAINLAVSMDDLVLESSGECPGEMTFTVSGAQPQQAVALLYSKSVGVFEIPRGACGGQLLGLDMRIKMGATTTSDENGVAVFKSKIPESVCGGIWIQAVDKLSCVVSNVEVIE